MYTAGDRIVYGNTGVCKVEKVTTLHLRGVDKDRLYYVLKPLYQDGIIRTPVDNDKVFTRPVMTKEEAENLVDAIPNVKVSACNEKNLNALRNHYQGCLDSFDCRKLVGLTKSIRAKRKEAEKRKKKLGMTDERYLRRAEDLLFGELAVALGIPRDDVPEYISLRLKSQKRSALSRETAPVLGAANP